ncbi:MAG: DUF1330 domain-containing protein [Actinomycetota bacterium]
MYVSPTPESLAAVIERGFSGPVKMLNLLRFRDTADYSASPELAPDEPISGAEAYQVYSAHTMPHLTEAGGKVVFMGTGGPLLIGPSGAWWDRALIVEYPDIGALLSMTQNAAYLAGLGHRTAALADSRLLPLE